LLTGWPAQRLAAGPRVVVLRDRDTVAGLAARLPAARRVALVGNGGIALELAHALRGVEARGAPFAARPAAGVTDLPSAYFASIAGTVLTAHVEVRAHQHRPGLVSVRGSCPSSARGAASRRACSGAGQA
jgi:hypothetical protein